MMEEKEIRNLLQQNAEHPSYDFSSKTMRKIEAMEFDKKSLSLEENKSVIVYIIPIIFLALVGYSLFQANPQFTSFDMALPSLNFNWDIFSLNTIHIHFSWFIASAVLAFGFWAWIWWEKWNFKIR
ncbi:hypothetical protein [Marivirga sp.]|uniref:hypothetical protein n=1 Tax=Marivirga sp. TaxID=2018662 RepID=UPI003DA745DA